MPATVEDFTKDVGFTSGNIGLTHNTPLPDDGSPGYKCPCFYPDVDPEDEWGTCACGHHGEDEHNDDGECTIWITD